MKKKKPNIGKNRDLAATQGMLFEVRDEMMSRFLGVEHGLKIVSKDLADFKVEMKSEFKKFSEEMRSEYKSFSEEMRGEYKSFSEEMRAEYQKTTYDMKANYHKTALLVEEQRVNNKIVLDLIRMFADDHEELKSRISELEKNVIIIK